MPFLFNILFIALLTFPVIGHAQQTSDPEPPQALKDLRSAGSPLYYLGEYENMHGWVLLRQGKPEFFYENPERTAMVMGLIFNDEGQMMTMSQLSSLKEKYGDDLYATTGTARNPINPSPSIEQTAQVTSQPQAANTNANASNTANASRLGGRLPTKAEQMYADLIAANWVSMDANGQYDMFAFIDPDCPHCQDLVRDFADDADNGQLRLRAIPIGVNEPSLRRAAVLLASANPQEKLLAYANGNEAALPAPGTINTEGVESNMALMGKYNFDVTPIVVYRTQGGQIRLIRGVPGDYGNIVRDIQEN